MLNWWGGPYGKTWQSTLGPIRTSAGQVSVRPIRLRDAKTWSELRVRNEQTLVPWEPTGMGTWEQRHHTSQWGPLYSALRSEAKRGTILPYVIELDGRYVGQLTVGNIQRGAVRSAWIGYWIDSEHFGGGIATAAVALGVDHCFGRVGLHRLDATVRPANQASQAVLAKVGFRNEGLLKRYMDVNSQWRDHLLFALTVEDLPTSAVEALVRSGRASY